jgi:GntR family transcriptional regulator
MADEQGVDILDLAPANAGLAGSEHAPKYRQVLDALRSSIKADAEATDKSLPIEREIAAHFGVSKITVRQALDLLEQEGFIKKIHAKPARIVSRVPKVPPSRRLSSIADLLGSSIRVRSTVLDYGLHEDPVAAARLGVTNSTRLYRLRLTHFNETRQIGYGEATFPPRVGELLSREMFVNQAADGSLRIFKVAESASGLHADDVQATIGAEVNDPKHPKLDTPQMVPLLWVQLLFSQGGTPFQLTNTWFDGDFYKLSYDLDV